MTTDPVLRRAADALWLVAVPVAIIVGYLGLGIAVLLIVPEPILASAVLGGVAIVVGLLLRTLRSEWFAFSPEPMTVDRAPGGSTRTWLLIALGVMLAFVAGQATAVGLYEVLGSDAYDTAVQARTDAAPIVVILLALVVAPIAEETLFRGLAYPLLRRRAGVVASVVASSVGFAVLHGNLVQIAAVLPLAALLAFVYEYSRKLWHCVLIHLAFNVAATLVPAGLVDGIAGPVTIALVCGGFVSCMVLLGPRVTGRAPAAIEQDGEGEAVAPRVG